MNILVVEDTKITDGWLEVMLSEIPGIKGIRYAADEQDAIRQIGATPPDVVVLDISLQPGISVLRAIKMYNPAIKVVMLDSNHTGKIYDNHCKNAGADYFFDKSVLFIRVRTRVRAALWHLIHACGHGQSVFQLAAASGESR